MQVHPGHGAGSACGKALGAVPSSTVGYERLYSWWGPYLTTNDEQGFIDELLAANQAAAQEMWDHLVRVGIDKVAGFVTSFDGLPTSIPRLIQPSDLDAVDAALVLDVRNRTEHSAGHIPGSQQLSGGRVMWNLDQLPTNGTIVSYCQSGVRNSVAASALRRAGYDVVELDGSYLGWAAWQQSRETVSAGK